MDELQSCRTSAAVSESSSPEYEQFPKFFLPGWGKLVIISIIVRKGGGLMSIR